ncbi:gliding motility-associated C-terminal domain-containing protein [Flavobacteriales bacterium]|nr:gliding motility-associated C-terminal domain-containing protein [Flavobacteriales bacterium]
MNKIATILILSFLICTGKIFSQEMTEFVAEYQVTAIQAGNSEIISTSNTIETIPEIFLYVPNAFTPNGDGLNDTFGALGHGAKEYHMEVFNKWGELIFESDDMGTQWNGTFQGEKVLPGTYIYSINATSYYNKDVQRQGSISIVKI